MKEKNFQLEEAEEDEEGGGGGSSGTNFTYSTNHMLNYIMNATFLKCLKFFRFLNFFLTTRCTKVACVYINYKRSDIKLDKLKRSFSKLK